MVTGNGVIFERFLDTPHSVTASHYFGHHRVSQIALTESDICHKCNRRNAGEARAELSAVGAGFPCGSLVTERH
jgi:hypothetical protein